MDSSLGFKVISSGRADADMDEEVSDGASTGFEIQGATSDLTRTPSTISVDTASFHTADGLESDYPRELVLNAAEFAGDDLSSRLVKQGAQYFSANEGESDSDFDDRSTLRPGNYIVDPDQPKLALAEESVQPSPAIEKHPPSPREECHGNEYRHGNQHSRIPNERSPLLSSSQDEDDNSTKCCTLL